MRRPRSRVRLVAALASIAVVFAAASGSAGPPAPWTPARLMQRSFNYPFALHPDGSHIVASPAAGAAGTALGRLVLVTNVLDELRGGGR